MNKYGILVISMFSMLGAVACSGGSETSDTAAAISSEPLADTNPATEPTAPSSAGGSRTIVEAILTSNELQGVSLDEGCVQDVVDQLSDADTALIMANLPAVEAGATDMMSLGISDEALTIFLNILDCVPAS